jgi:hypothetical protein
VRGNLFSVRLTAAAALLLLASPVVADDGIGRAAAVTTVVTGAVNGSAATPISRGDDVFQNQVIETDANGVGQIEFLDKTKLAIGPGSTMTLDTFVYNPNKTADKVVIELGKGTFRFITGKSDHTAYQISTPTATLGLRGTAFDVAVAENGVMAVAMLDGEIEACSTVSGACQVHNLVGKFLRITPDGLFTIHDRWDETIMGGVEFAAALPFTANQNLLQPAFKTTRRVATLYVNAAGQVIQAPVKAIKPVGNLLKKLNPFR